MQSLSAPPHNTRDESLRLVQVVMRALHATDIGSWCAVELTMPQLKALLLVDSASGASHGEIARGLGVGLSTVTGIVDRLVEHGLVERYTDPDDRRMSRVRVTDIGSELLDGLWATRGERLGQALASLSQQERSNLQNALQQLADLLGEQV
jgi:DNA-binding MarR family transcriptional regulator